MSIHLTIRGRVEGQTGLLAADLGTTQRAEPIHFRLPESDTEFDGKILLVLNIQTAGYFRPQF